MFFGFLVFCFFWGRVAPSGFLVFCFSGGAWPLQVFWFSVFLVACGPFSLFFCFLVRVAHSGFSFFDFLVFWCVWLLQVFGFWFSGARLPLRLLGFLMFWFALTFHLLAPRVSRSRAFALRCLQAHMRSHSHSLMI